MKIKLLCLVMLSTAVYAQFGKIPYFVPQNDHIKFNEVYVLQDDEEALCLLRLINAKQYEWVRYSRTPQHSIATRVTAKYHVSKKHKLLFAAGDEQLIIADDTLIYAINGSKNYEAQDHLNSYYFNKGKFYNTRLNAIIKRKPVIESTPDESYRMAWFISPESKQSLITGPCNEPDNLDCLCAALTHEKTTPQEQVDAISSFIIERLHYNRGDTAQNNIKGLVFGNEREAVCEGYSRVFKDLMERLNFKTDYVSGAVRTDVYDIFYTGHSHAWNQTIINGKPYGLDITWSNSLNDSWYLMPPKDLQITHFSLDYWNKVKNWGDSTMTMYEFMNQPLINPIMDGGSEKIKVIDKIAPLQFAQGTFTLNFQHKLTINSVSRQELSYPFVKFEGQKGDVASKVIAQSGSISQKTSTNKLEINLPEKVNNLKIDIAGIGTLHYVVFNGTKNEFYQYLIDHREPLSPHSMALAFLACAKLNDENVFNSLKADMEEGISFKEFMKEAKINHIDDFEFTTFNATKHISFSLSNNDENPVKKSRKRDRNEFSVFQGYSFEYSEPYNKEVNRIFMSEAEEHQYIFHKFGVH